MASILAWAALTVVVLLGLIYFVARHNLLRAQAQAQAEAQATLMPPSAAGSSSAPPKPPVDASSVLAGWGLAAPLDAASTAIDAIRLTWELLCSASNVLVFPSDPVPAALRAVDETIGTDNAAAVAQIGAAYTAAKSTQSSGSDVSYWCVQAVLDTLEVAAAFLGAEPISVPAVCGLLAGCRVGLTSLGTASSTAGAGQAGVSFAVSVGDALSPLESALAAEDWPGAQTAVPGVLAATSRQALQTALGGAQPFVVQAAQAWAGSLRYLLAPITADK